MYWGGAVFEPGTTDLLSGAPPLSHLSSDAELIWYRINLNGTYLVSNLFDIKLIWYRAYLIQNLFDTELQWYQTYLILDLFDIELILQWTFPPLYIFSVIVYFVYLCHSSESSTGYCAVPGGNPTKDWQSFAMWWGGAGSNLGLLICCQVLHHWATSPLILNIFDSEFIWTKHI